MGWFSRLANMIRPTRVSEEIDEELRFHLDARTVANVSKGMSWEEARIDAIKRMGNTAVARHESYAADVLLWVETVIQDIRYGMRNLRSNPLVSVVAVVSIALAIGATTAIFSIVHAVLLRELPYRDPNRIVIL